jgi:hypothetical protein
VLERVGQHIEQRGYYGAERERDPYHGFGGIWQEKEQWQGQIHAPSYL